MLTILGNELNGSLRSVTRLVLDFGLIFRLIFILPIQQAYSF